MATGIMNDPEFVQLSVEERRELLKRVDPEFDGLSREEQLKVVLQVGPGQVTGGPPASMGEQGPFRTFRQSPTRTAIGPLSQGEAAQPIQAGTPSARAPIPPQGLGELAGVSQRPLARLVGGEPSAGEGESRALMSGGGEAAGALLGIRAGAPAGPLGMIGGGALGSVLGSMGGEAFAEAVGVDPSDSVAEMLGRMGWAGAFGGIGSLTGVTIESLKTSTLRRIAGINEESRLLQERMGLPISIETTTNRMPARRARNVLGRFPLLSAPFREADIRRAERATEAPGELLSEVAPLAPVSNLSERSVRRARALWDRFRKQANQRYRDVEKLSEETPHEIRPTYSTIAALEGREELAAVAAESAQDTRTLSILNELIERESPMTFKEYRATAKAISSRAQELARAGNNQSAGILMRVRSEMDKDFLTIRSDSEEMVQQALEANRFFSEGMKLFETPTAGRFMQTDRTIFDLGFSSTPTREADRMIPVVFREDSPAAMRDLRELVGDRIFRQSAANHLEGIFRNHTAVVTDGADKGRMRINTAKLQEDLGLFQKRSPRRRALAEMLKTTNVDVRDFERMVRGLEQMSDSKFVNVSDFVSRRAMLGGFKSGLRSFTPGAPNQVEGVGDLIRFVGGGLAFLFTFRKTARFLTDPRFVRRVNRAMNEELPEAARQQSLFRLGRMIADDVDSTAEEVEALGLSVGAGPLTGRGPSVAGGLGALGQLLSPQGGRNMEGALQGLRQGGQ